MVVGTERILALTEPVATLTEYQEIGGGQGLAAARRRPRERVAADLRAAGLGGVPWAAATVIADATEAAPGSFRDRHLLRRNPFQVLEGLAIAAYAAGAGTGLLVIRRRFELEIARLLVALDDLRAAGVLGPVRLQVVIRDEAPACLDLETLSTMPELLRTGCHPSTTVVTVSGDVCRPAVGELPVGLTPRLLAGLLAGGLAPGRKVTAVFAGTTGEVLTGEQLDHAVDPGGLVVYDDSACPVAATRAFARLTAAEPVVLCLDAIERGDGTWRELDTLARLGTGFVASALDRFPEEFEAHLGRPCPLPRDLPVPAIADYDEETGYIVYDQQPLPPTGTSAITLVPAPGRERTSRFPPISSARSAMLPKP
jgi:hypothetical protein